MEARCPTPRQRPKRPCRERSLDERGGGHQDESTAANMANADGNVRVAIHAEAKGHVHLPGDPWHKA